MKGNKGRANPMTAWATSHQGLLSLPSLRVGKWVPAAAGKAKANLIPIADERVCVCR